MSLSPRNFFNCSRLLLSCTRVSAEEFERRSEIPNDSLGATRSLTFGTYVMRLFHMSSHVSPGCTSVEYVRSPRPFPRSIVKYYPLVFVAAAAMDDDWRLKEYTPTPWCG